MSKIIKPSNIGWNPNWSLEEHGMSQSLWSSWLKCNRLFLLKINGYIGSGSLDNFNFGNNVHEVFDQVYTRGQAPSRATINKYINKYIDQQLKEERKASEKCLELDAAKTEALLPTYFEFYKNDFKNKKFYEAEELFQVMYRGVKLRGKIDAKFMANNKKWTFEHKTKGQINEKVLTDFLLLDFQNLYYILSDELQTGEPAFGTLYNVIRNPGSKPKVNESLKMFMERLENEVRKKPEHYFKRYEVPYTSKERKIFKFELNHHIADLKNKIGKPVASNRFGCKEPFPCEFLLACSGDTCANLIKSKKPVEEFLYPELKETKDVEKNKRLNNKKTVKKIAKRIRLKKKL